MITFGRGLLYCCRKIPSLENKKVALNKLENILEHMHINNDEHVLHMLFSMETTEHIYLLLMLALGHKYSAQVFSTDMSYGLPFNTCINHCNNNHLNKYYYPFISDGRKLFSSDKTVKQRSGDGRHLIEAHKTIS